VFERYNTFGAAIVAGLYLIRYFQHKRQADLFLSLGLCFFSLVFGYWYLMHIHPQLLPPLMRQGSLPITIVLTSAALVFSVKSLYLNAKNYWKNL